MKEPDLDTLQEQFEDTLKLLKSPEWFRWLAFLKTRKTYLQNKVNEYTRQNDTLQAKVALALMDDVDKQVELFQKKFSDLESKLRSKK
jgi:hypothetical protein